MWNDPNAEMVVSQEVGHNEKLLWAGRPKGGLVLRATDVFLIPFSVVWTGFAIFWEAGAIIGTKGQGIGVLFALFGLPFVLIGIYLMFGRFIYDAVNRGRTFYGLTSDRLIMISGVFRPTRHSVPLRNLTDVSLTERRSGHGTITFGQMGMMMPYWRNQAPGPYPYNMPVLDLVPDAREVYGLLQEAIRQAATPPHS